MNEFEEEERETKFSIKDILKFILFLMVFVAVIASLFYFTGQMRKGHPSKEPIKEEDMGSEAKEVIPSPFIIDDEEKIPKVEKGFKKEEILSLEQEERVFFEEGDRICEYKEIDLPEILKKEDFVDVRLSLADGRDYTVLSSKKVGNFLKKEEKERIWLSLSDVEILIMESALADLSLFKNARLYLVIHNGRNTKKSVMDYPIMEKSEKQISYIIEKDPSKNTLTFLKDKELNEDRKKLIEAKIGRNDIWKEAASYWEKE